MPPTLTIQDLRASSTALHEQAASLHPDTLVTLFEIDLSGFTAVKNAPDSEEYTKVFRFHNLVKAFNGTNIVWSGNDSIPKTYICAPVQAIGFEYNAKGTLPTPKLSITANEEGISSLTVLKQRMMELGDLVGAKVTRIRTFVRYLDSVNFAENTPSITPDWTKEFPRDIFYIDRKSAENKYAIEFELASVMDVQGLVLPNRLTISRCWWQYRGCGCAYEFKENKQPIHEDATLLDSAPPIATANDELITHKDGKAKSILGNVPLNPKGKFNINDTYALGDYCYIEKDQVKYYYVSRVANNTYEPPNSAYWIEDACSKLLKGCKLRWAPETNPPRRASNISLGSLPYGGFPSVNRYGFNFQ